MGCWAGRETIDSLDEARAYLDRCVAVWPFVAAAAYGERPMGLLADRAGFDLESFRRLTLVAHERIADAVYVRPKE